jgi:hypothetical protein
LVHPDVAACLEQAEAHLAPYPFPDAADSRRSVARWWDADHDAVRPALMMDKADAIPGGILRRGLRAVGAGIWVGRELHLADARQGRFAAWAANRERPAWADGSVEAAVALYAAQEAPDRQDAVRSAA